MIFRDHIKILIINNGFTFAAGFLITPDPTDSCARHSTIPLAGVTSRWITRETTTMFICVGDTGGQLKKSI